MDCLGGSVKGVTYVEALRPLLLFHKALDTTHLQQDPTCHSVDILDPPVEHGIPLIHAHHRPRQLNRVIDRRQAETATRLLLLLLLRLGTVACLHRHQAHGILANLQSHRFTEGAADDGDDGVVFAREVVEEDGVGDSAVLVREAGSLQSDGVDEVVLVIKADQGSTLLDHTLDPSAIRSNVSDQLAELPCLKDQFTQSFVAETAMTLACFTSEIAVKADEREVVHSRRNIRGTEVTGVVSDHTTEVDLR